MSRPSNKPSARAQSQADRARWAWDTMENVDEADEEYLTEARKLPARLLTSGLGQTMAYLHAKAKGQELDDTKKGPPTGVVRLYSQLARRVRAVSKEDRVVMDIIVRLDARAYRVLGREMLATAEWIKRFAEGRVDSTAKKARKAKAARGGAS